MSPKEVGTNMKILSDECKDLLIEKWILQETPPGVSSQPQ